MRELIDSVARPSALAEEDARRPTCESPAPTLIDWRVPECRYRRLKPIHSDAVGEIVHKSIEEFEFNSGEASQLLLSDWMSNYQEERKHFHSIILFCRVKWQEVCALTASMGPLHQLKTAVAIDLFGKLCSTIPSQKLRNIVRLLQNEVILSTYEGGLTTLSMDVEGLMKNDTYYAIYPKLLQKVKRIRREAAEAKLSSKEMFDFERRKVFVVNHQTRRYEIQLLSVVFCSWRDGFRAQKSGLGKLNLFVNTLLKRKQETDTRDFLRSIWTAWCIWHLGRMKTKRYELLQRRRTMSVSAELEQAVAEEKFAKVNERSSQLVLQLTTSKNELKQLQLRVAKMNTTLKGMGEHVLAGVNVVVRLKKIVEPTLGSHLRTNIENISRQIMLGLPDSASIEDLAHNRIQDYLDENYSAKTLLYDNSEQHKLLSLLPLSEEDCQLLKFALDHGSKELTYCTILSLLPAKLSERRLKERVSAIEKDDDIERALTLIKASGSSEELQSESSSKEDSAAVNFLEKGFSRLLKLSQTSRQSLTRAREEESKALTEALEALSSSINDPFEKSSTSQKDSRKVGNGRGRDGDNGLTCFKPRQLLVRALQHEKAYSNASVLEKQKVWKKIKSHERRLKRIFRTYAGLSAEGSRDQLSLQELWKFLRDCHIPVLETAVTLTVDHHPLHHHYRYHHPSLASSPDRDSVAMKDAKLPSRDLMPMFVRVVRIQEELGSSGDKIAEENDLGTASSLEVMTDEDCLSCELGYEEWIILLLLIAQKKYGNDSLSKSLEMLLNQHVLVRATSDEAWCEFLANVSSKPVQAALQKHRKLLKHIFALYSKQSGGSKGSLSHLDYNEFRQFWEILNLEDIKLEQHDLRTIFAKVGAVVVDDAALDGKELTYPEFLQAIAAIACYWPPTRSPFVPLEEKVHRFIHDFLKERHASTSAILPDRTPSFAF